MALLELKDFETCEHGKQQVDYVFHTRAHPQAIVACERAKICSTIAENPSNHIYELNFSVINLSFVQNHISGSIW
jgi:hypothetical protein